MHCILYGKYSERIIQDSDQLRAHTCMSVKRTGSELKMNCLPQLIDCFQYYPTTLVLFVAGDVHKQPWKTKRTELLVLKSPKLIY